MGSSGFATTLVGAISVAIFLYVSSLCFPPRAPSSHKFSIGLIGEIAVGPLQTRPHFKPSGY